jgi:hypothetical protein
MSVVMLNVVMLSVIMLSVVAPLKTGKFTISRLAVVAYLNF